jgi:hypothetical protein
MFNRSLLVLGFDCVPLFHSGEVLSRWARVQRSSEASRRATCFSGLGTRDSGLGTSQGLLNEPPPITLVI